VATDFIEEEWGAENRLEQPGTFAVGAGTMGSFRERHRETWTLHVGANASPRHTAPLLCDPMTGAFLADVDWKS
jgi:uncharacterized iron-regulated membrane protein